MMEKYFNEFSVTPENLLVGKILASVLVMDFCATTFISVAVGASLVLFLCIFVLVSATSVATIFVTLYLRERWSIENVLNSSVFGTTGIHSRKQSSLLEII